MKVLVVGKLGSIVLWTENIITAFRHAGHATFVFAINGRNFWEHLQISLTKGIRKSSLAGMIAAKFARTMQTLNPDLVLVAGAFGVPLELYQVLADCRRRPWVVGLVGDRFAIGERQKAELIDWLYFSDTSFMKSAAAAGFPKNYSYLALAVDPRHFRPRWKIRVNEMLLVANRTPHRNCVVRQIRTPMTVYGSDWRHLKQDSIHHVHPRLIGQHELAVRYAGYRAVLNIRNERNVDHGLNQRSFEPMACRTVVVNDDLKDLERCFEPRKEILVYRDMEELNMLYLRLQRDQRFAETVAEAGYRRVLAEHTYAHRVATILSDMGI